MWLAVAISLTVRRMAAQRLGIFMVAGEICLLQGRDDLRGCHDAAVVSIHARHHAGIGNALHNFARQLARVVHFSHHNAFGAASGLPYFLVGKGPEGLQLEHAHLFARGIGRGGGAAGGAG